ncbi:MAG TPA: prolipoprotein diacylglyceryl transferase [Magnetospirillaceae bacterium]|jgi:phosphatidylglycerol:prolipoprotein diacylglycerol transferase
MALVYPQIDPVIVRLGPLALRWYAVAYMAGLFGGWRYVRYLATKPPRPISAEQIDDFLVWATIGVVLGGRLGYILFYKPLTYLHDPMEAIAIWHGGMSFHGGLLGVIIAIVLFTRRNKLSTLSVGDLISVVAPMGLFFGRIANFINGELVGRIAPPDLPWAMIYPQVGPEPRYPSELMEAGLEGLALFIIMYVLWRIESLRMRPGVLTGCFMIGYAAARIFSEFFREPDAFLGPVIGQATMGQVLSIPVALAGIALVIWSRRKTP